MRPRVRASSPGRTKQPRQEQILGKEDLRRIKVDSELFFHRQIVGKISDFIGLTTSPPKWFTSFAKCGKPSGAVLKCFGCGGHHPVIHHCDLKFCPVCVWKITQKRRERLTAWAKMIKSPKHLVLTQRNFPEISRAKIRTHYENLRKIRRHKLFKGVRGGSVSVEITNDAKKGTGWHLHSHWLIDCDFIDMKKLSIAWGALCDQEFGIVQYRELKDQSGKIDESYVAECLKYVTKGSEAAEWEGKDLFDYITAIRGSRFFFVFGSLFKMRAEVKKLLEGLQEKKETTCKECGSIEVYYLPEEGMDWEREKKFISR